MKKCAMYQSESDRKSDRANNKVLQLTSVTKR